MAGEAETGPGGKGIGSTKRACVRIEEPPYAVGMEYEVLLYACGGYLDWYWVSSRWRDACGTDLLAHLAVEGLQHYNPD